MTLQCATLSLIPSFGACTRSCFVPRYRSVVWTDACPNSNWICSSSPPAARHNLAHVLLKSCGADPRNSSRCRVPLEQLPDDLFAQAGGLHLAGAVHGPE